MKMSDPKNKIKLFEERQVRAVWDEDAGKWWCGHSCPQSEESRAGMPMPPCPVRGNIYRHFLYPEGVTSPSVGQRPTLGGKETPSPERATSKRITPLQGLKMCVSRFVGRCPTLVYFRASP